MATDADFHSARAWERPGVASVTRELLYSLAGRMSAAERSTAQ